MTRHTRMRLAFPDLPTPEPSGRAERRAASEAHLRACPPARMLDYGADPAEADFYVSSVRADAPWTATGLTLADRRRELARRAQTDGLLGTAAVHLRAAAVLAGIAQLHDLGDIERRPIYERVIEDYCRAHEVGSPIGCRAERVTVPGHPEIVGWLKRPTSPSAGPVGPPPVVLVWGGLSGWGPAYDRCTDELVGRGLAACLVELPGQGEPRLIRGHVLDGNLESSVAALIDTLTARPDLSKTVGVWGHSVGGVFALRVAAAGLVSACCVNGGAGDPRVQLERFSRLRSQFAALVGTEAIDAIHARLDTLRFATGRDTIDCPLLVLHGEADPLETAADAAQLHERSGSPDATLVSVAGGEHCLYSFARQRDALVTDWFCGRLVAGAAR